MDTCVSGRNSDEASRACADDFAPITQANSHSGIRPIEQAPLIKTSLLNKKII